MECRVDLNREEVEKMVTECVTKVMTPPRGKAWDTIFVDFGSVHCVLVEEKKK